MSSFVFGFTFPKENGNSNDLAIESDTNRDKKEEGKSEMSRGMNVQMTTTTANAATENESLMNSRERKPIHILNIKEKLRTCNIQYGTTLNWKHDVISLHGNHSLRRIHPVEKPLGSSTAKRIDQNSDLVSGVYEGGLKVWECSIDLCNYMVEESEFTLDPLCNVSGGGSVLELGCGHGLPACLALKHMMQHYFKCTNSNQNGNYIKPTSSVVFTDFNDYVLSDVTLPNIILNTMAFNNGSNDIILSSNLTSYLNQVATLVSGDWMDVSEYLEDQSLKGAIRSSTSPRFHLVLAAETTYTPESSKDTAYLLLHHLSKDGIGLVACKRYYFGVGGGSDAFVCAAKHMVLKDGNVSLGLQLKLIREYDDGKSNIRDLWLVKVVER